MFRMKGYEHGRICCLSTESSFITCKLIPIVAFAQFSICNYFKSSKIFVSIVHIVIVSEKIEFEFCRALVNIINMQQEENRIQKGSLRNS